MGTSDMGTNADKGTGLIWVWHGNYWPCRITPWSRAENFLLSHCHMLLKFSFFQTFHRDRGNRWGTTSRWI